MRGYPVNQWLTISVCHELFSGSADDYRFAFGHERHRQPAGLRQQPRVIRLHRMRIGGGGASAAGGVGTSVLLPKRCQYWFKLGTQYFFADSDTDRSAKVLSRTIKQ